jgi:hypothetical protein
MIEDARAMIRQQWAADMRTIDMIHVGYKCKFVDNVSAHVAMQSVGNGMERQKIDAGLIGDPQLNAMSAIEDRIAKNNAKFSSKTCAALNPADRGRIRSLVSMLMRG